MLQVNPIQIIQAIKQGKNPEQLMLGILQGELVNTPMGQNLLALAKQGKSKDIEQIARNLLKQQGLDFDKEFLAFKQQLGL